MVDAAQVRRQSRFLIAQSATDIYGANRKGQKIALPLNMAHWAASKFKLNHRTSFTLDGELIGEKYFVFDILESNGRLLNPHPYHLRLSILSQLRSASSDVEFAETAKTHLDKVALFNRLQAEHAEGVVFKQHGAPYTPGRGPTQLKLKFWESASSSSKRTTQVYAVSNSDYWKTTRSRDGATARSQAITQCPPSAQSSRSSICTWTTVSTNPSTKASAPTSSARIVSPIS